MRVLARAQRRSPESTPLLSKHECSLSLGPGRLVTASSRPESFFDVHKSLPGGGGVGDDPALLTLPKM